MAGPTTQCINEYLPSVSLAEVRIVTLSVAKSKLLLDPSFVTFSFIVDPPIMSLARRDCVFDRLRLGAGSMFDNARQGLSTEARTPNMLTSEYALVHQLAYVRQA